MREGDKYISNGQVLTVVEVGEKFCWIEYVNGFGEKTKTRIETKNLMTKRKV